MITPFRSVVGVFLHLPHKKNKVSQPYPATNCTGNLTHPAQSVYRFTVIMRMKIGKAVRILLFLILPADAFSQTFEKTFAGSWADTRWYFIFKKDGTYKRISNGHYGNTEITGNYKMYNDTVELTSGYEGTNKTVNPLYLLDKQGRLIDYWLRYDYVPFEASKKEYAVFPSQLRAIKYPQTDTKDTSQKKQLTGMLLQFLCADTVRKTFSDIRNSSEILIGNYYQLSENTIRNIKNEILTLKFINPDKITKDFYIEIEDINMNPEEVWIRLNIKGAQRSNVWATYHKVDGKWVEPRIHIFKYY